MNFPAGGRVRLDLMALGIFVLALSARLIHVLAIRESPFFDNLIVDSVDFDARATAFLKGSWPEEGAFFQAPLYPFFLAGIYRIFGHDLMAVRILQGVLGSLSAVLVYMIGIRCAGKAAGAVAAFLYSLYAMSIHFDSEILRPSLVVFLALLSLHLMLKASRGQKHLWWASAGFALGFASIARPTMLSFLPLGFLWAVFHGGGIREKRTRSARSGALLLAACALVPVVAVTAINYAKSGSFVLISYNGGINFYIGNNPDYDGTVGIRPGIRWDLLTSEPPVDRRTDPAGWSRYYYQKALNFALSEPRSFMALQVKKFALFWNGHEIERNVSFEHVAKYSPFMANPLISFRWVAPLAIVGMLLAWRRKAAVGLPALFLISQMATTVMFFVCARYRMTSVPILCLFSGYAAVALAEMVRRRSPAAIAYLAVGLLAGVAVNVDAYGVSKQRNSRPDYELAMILRREGRTDEAAQLLERAIQEDKNDPDPLFQRGVFLAGRGRYDEAASAFLAAAQLEPGYAKSWFNLGLSLSRAGNTASAVDAYQRALEALPSYWEAAVGLGDALIVEERHVEAAAAFEKSLTVARSRSEAAVSRMSLGRAHALAGDYVTALEHFGEAVLLSPGSIDARLAKARVLLVLDRVDEAANEAAMAAQIDSTDARVKALLRDPKLKD